jgi:hypothetical protein
MSPDNIDDIIKGLRKAELGSIASNKLLNNTQNIDIAINKTRSSNTNYIDTLTQSNVPFINSEQFLTDSQIDISKISIDELLDSDELLKIQNELNRPLIKRAKWDRCDYIVAFMVSLLGVSIDTLVGNPQKGVSAICSDKNSFIGSWFEKIHSLHSPNSPMDYQGFKMGGGGHRLRSIGHDLLGFPYGIWQIMNGTFSGGFYQDGKFSDILSNVNQYGNAYESQSFIESIFTYTGHVVCDFFSSNSLPIPGFGILAQLPSRDIRTFAADMYNNGYNFRHMMIQGFSVLFIEIIIRTYAYFRFKKVQGLTNEQYLQKRRELLLLSHSIVAGFNIGKVVVTGNVLSLNIPQILAVVFHFIPFVMFHYRNNNETKKIIRNINDLKGNQIVLEQKIAKDMKESIVFNDFIKTKPLILNF